MVYAEGREMACTRLGCIGMACTRLGCIGAVGLRGRVLRRSARPCREDLVSSFQPYTVNPNPSFQTRNPNSEPQHQKPKLALYPKAQTPPPPPPPQTPTPHRKHQMRLAGEGLLRTVREQAGAEHHR